MGHRRGGGDGVGVGVERQWWLSIHQNVHDYPVSMFQSYAFNLKSIMNFAPCMGSQLVSQIFTANTLRLAIECVSCSCVYIHVCFVFFLLYKFCMCNGPNPSHQCSWFPRTSQHWIDKYLVVVRVCYSRTYTKQRALFTTFTINTKRINGAQTKNLVSNIFF